MPRIVGLLAVVALLPTAAAAQPRQLSYDSSGGSLRCETAAECTPGDACTDATECGRSAASTDNICHAGLNSYFCCDDNEDCTLTSAFYDARGECVDVSGVSFSGGAARVCVFSSESSAPTFCGDLSRDRLIACLTQPPPVGGPAPTWAEGDCDGDGVSNGSEWYAPVSCDPCDEYDVPSGDGTGCVTADAGPPRVDAGTDVNDAGPGVPPGPTPGFAFNGGGGCTCHVGGRGAPPWPLALLALALWLRRSRR